MQIRSLLRKRLKAKTNTFRDMVRLQRVCVYSASAAGIWSSALISCLVFYQCVPRLGYIATARTGGGGAYKATREIQESFARKDPGDSHVSLE